jgi:UDP-N-acetylmuramoyl-L-alanyl-D-glutamate--2,6-diaminopimelate ligase
MYEYDSRKIKPGAIFLCLPKADAYCEEAMLNGANDIIKCTRAEMSELANKKYGFPSNKLKVVGVTGTNGKSSVTSFVHQGLQRLGENSYLQGTLSARLTTPESLDSIKAMRSHLDDGGTYFVMEVSSHGIHQNRVDGIEFDVKCLTNISQDHLDYHSTFDAYKQVKLSFMNEFSGVSIFPQEFNEFSHIKNNQVYGAFNQENLKAAYAILLYLGFDDSNCREALKQVICPEGRFEFIDIKNMFKVVVDYAHTPDGLKGVCSEAKNIAKKSDGKLFVCFGCGGDRDRSKRQKMAEEASKVADFLMVTQDNPRHEDPNQIVEDILQGISASVEHKVVHDRQLAIEAVLALASSNDVVLIAGKGHEDYQIIGSERHYFKDKDVVINWYNKQNSL